MIPLFKLPNGARLFRSTDAFLATHLGPFGAQSSVTFGGIDIGPAETGRLVLGIWSWEYNPPNRTVSSATIGGSTGTQVVTETYSGGGVHGGGVSFISRVMNTGTTTDFAITLSNVVEGIQLSVYSIYGLDSTTVRDTAKANAVSVTSQSVNIDFLKDGIGIFAYAMADSKPSLVWDVDGYDYENSYLASNNAGKSVSVMSTIAKRDSSNQLVYVTHSNAGEGQALAGATWK